ncbi:hypothetical protein P7C70_g7017, partial [Phenoliferia sp. Uapishka_3]
MLPSPWNSRDSSHPPSSRSPRSPRSPASPSYRPVISAPRLVQVHSEYVSQGARPQSQSAVVMLRVGEGEGEQAEVELDLGAGKSAEVEESNTSRYSTYTREEVKKLATPTSSTEDLNEYSPTSTPALSPSSSLTTSPEALPHKRLPTPILTARGLGIFNEELPSTPSSSTTAGPGSAPTTPRAPTERYWEKHSFSYGYDLRGNPDSSPPGAPILLDYSRVAPADRKRIKMDFLCDVLDHLKWSFANLMLKTANSKHERISTRVGNFLNGSTDLVKGGGQYEPNIELLLRAFCRRPAAQPKVHTIVAPRAVLIAKEEVLRTGRSGKFTIHATTLSSAALLRELNLDQLVAKVKEVAPTLWGILLGAASELNHRGRRTVKENGGELVVRQCSPILAALSAFSTVLLCHHTNNNLLPLLIGIAMAQGPGRKHTLGITAKFSLTPAYSTTRVAIKSIGNDVVRRAVAEGNVSEEPDASFLLRSVTDNVNIEPVKGIVTLTNVAKQLDLTNSLFMRQRAGATRQDWDQERWQGARGGQVRMTPQDILPQKENDDYLFESSIRQWAKNLRKFWPGAEKHSSGVESWTHFKEIDNWIDDL